MALESEGGRPPEPAVPKGRVPRRTFLLGLGGAGVAGGVVAVRGERIVAGIRDRYTGLSSLSERDQLDLQLKAATHMENVTGFSAEVFRPEFLNLLHIEDVDMKTMVELWKDPANYNHIARGRAYRMTSYGYIGSFGSEQYLDVAYRSSYDAGNTPTANEALVTFEPNALRIPGIATEDGPLPPGNLVAAAQRIFKIPPEVPIEDNAAMTGEFKAETPNNRTYPQVLVYGHSNDSGKDLGYVVGYRPY